MMTSHTKQVVGSESISTGDFPTHIPSISKAVLLKAYGRSPALEVVERMTPRPGPGQVLVRITAAPINPSDLGFLQGTYGIHKDLPIVPGIEGAGTVVAVGKGFLARRLLGRRVACSGLTSGDGTWAEFAVLDANRCISLSPKVTDEEAACMFVNPWTVIALTQIAGQGGHKALLLTAGASQLSRMILRLAWRQRKTSIHIVRSSEQVQLLESLGAKHILNSSERHFKARLTEACERLNAKFALDAVGGEMTGLLAQAMPPGSRIVVYGGLANQPCQVEVADLVFKGIMINGFWLTHWLARKNFLQLLFLGQQVQRLLNSDFRTEIRQQLPITEIHHALELSTSSTTGGRILLVPGK